MQAIITVLVFPPSESCSSLVSFESRYGMWFVLPSTRALMTLPRLDNDWLMLAASLSVSPAAPVLLCRSEPARSTRLSLEYSTLFCVLPPRSFSVSTLILRQKTLWLRLLQRLHSDQSLAGPGIVASLHAFLNAGPT